MNSEKITPLNQFNNILKKISYLSIANLLNLVVSTGLILTIPKFIGVIDFGYWQLYLFYASYVALLHFGWVDGIYLRHGGKNIKDFKKEEFSTQFIVYCLYFISLTSFLIFIAYTNNNEQYHYIFLAISLNLIIVNIRSFYFAIILASGEIKTYSLILTSNQIFLVIFISFFSVSFDLNFKFLIIADLLAKTLTLIMAFYSCKNIHEFKLSLKNKPITEIKINLATGLPMLLAHITGLLTIGVIRFGIERNWSIEIFGTISLMLSVTNIIIIFLQSGSLILFPILKKIDFKKFFFVYKKTNTILNTLLLATLIFYFPIILFITWWLPEYKNGIPYLALIFPLFIYEGRTTVLINTFLKSLNLQKIILYCNLFSLIISIVFSLIFTWYLENILLTLISIPIISAIRSYALEWFLIKNLSSSSIKINPINIFFTTLFTLSLIFFNNLEASIFTILIYIIYVFYNRTEILEAYYWIKKNK